MRVFVTGATGYIGSAVVRDLIDAGHQVLGLTRSDKGRDSLIANGAEASRGNLEDLDSLRRGAANCDGVIHTAFVHDFANFAKSVETDRRAVEALVNELEGSNKPLVIASGTLIVSHKRPSTEEDVAATPDVPRAGSETLILDATSHGILGSIVRLAPVVHDLARAGLVSRIIPLAREKGTLAFVGDGANRWPAVHRLDAAQLFRLPLEELAGQLA